MQGSAACAGPASEWPEDCLQCQDSTQVQAPHHVRCEVSSASSTNTSRRCRKFLGFQVVRVIILELQLRLGCRHFVGKKGCCSTAAKACTGLCAVNWASCCSWSGWGMVLSLRAGMLPAHAHHHVLWVLCCCCTSSNLGIHVQIHQPPSRQSWGRTWSNDSALAALLVHLVLLLGLFSVVLAGPAKRLQGTWFVVVRTNATMVLRTTSVQSVMLLIYPSLLESITYGFSQKQQTVCPSLSMFRPTTSAVPLQLPPSVCPASHHAPCLTAQQAACCRHCKMGNHAVAHTQQHHEPSRAQATALSGRQTLTRKHERLVSAALFEPVLPVVQYTRLPHSKQCAVHGAALATTTNHVQHGRTCQVRRWTSMVGCGCQCCHVWCMLHHEALVLRVLHYVRYLAYGMQGTFSLKCTAVRWMDPTLLAHSMLAHPAPCHPHRPAQTQEGICAAVQEAPAHQQDTHG